MTDTALQFRREYQKQWRDSNKEKVKLYNKRYWEKKAQNFEKIMRGEGDTI